jgi:hypothetical protein
MISSTRTGIAADANAAYPVCNDAKTTNALPKTDFTADFLFVDKIKAAGYSGITYDYSVWVDADGTVTNKYTHEDMWKILAYAKSIGLTPNVKVHWGEPANECGNLNTWTTPATFNVNLFLTGVKTLFAEVSPKAEAAGVKLMFLGTENDNLVTSQYHAQWADIVATIKASYTGKIAYDGNYMGLSSSPFAQIGIWDLVDKISLSFYPSLQDTPATTVAEVIADYTSRPAVGTTITNIVSDIKNLNATYGKNVIVGEVNWIANPNTLSKFISPQDIVASNQLTVDDNQRQLAYKAFFEVMNTQLAGVVTGVNVWGYDFWQLNPTGNPWAAANPVVELLGTPTEAMLKPYLTCNKAIC